MRSLFNIIVLTSLLAGSALAQSAEPAAGDAAKLSEGLIFSVSRVPERPFETARAVRVITREEI